MRNLRLPFCLLCFLVNVTGAARARGDGITAETIEFNGWKNNLRISNGEAEIIVTLDVGPRVIRFRRLDGENVFKDIAEQSGKSAEKDWMARGGHRVWTAPEDVARTYHPDNGPVRFERTGDRFHFRAAPEASNGLQKELTVRLAATGSRVTIENIIKNVGAKPTTLSPAGITMMAPGGLAIIPLPPKSDHPGLPSQADSDAAFAPNQRIVLWPFFDFRDDRYTFGGRYLTVQQKALRQPTQLGLMHRTGWTAYLNQKTLFLKRFQFENTKTYPDLGCNFIAFCNADCLEMRAQGPMFALQPGESAKLTEYWELIPNVDEPKGETGIDLKIRPLVEKKNQ